MSGRQAWELAGKVTAALIIAIVAITLAVVAFQEAAPQPYLPWVDASAPMWTDVGPSPPQFCPSPYPICRGDGCTKPRSVA